MNSQRPTVRDIVAALRYYDAQIARLFSSSDYLGYEGMQKYGSYTLKRIDALRVERAEWQAAFDEARQNLRRASR